MGGVEYYILTCAISSIYIVHYRKCVYTDEYMHIDR